MILGGMWSAMIKQYPQTASQMPAEVNRDNLKFIDTHPEIVEKWQGMWEGAGRQGKRAAKAPDESAAQSKQPWPAPRCPAQDVWARNDTALRGRRRPVRP